MSDDDDDSLTCPITLELFRDPVRAEDGRLYERKAITRWIHEHGTSPFTRQMLDINDLQPDDEVRKRAKLRRRATTAHTRKSDHNRLLSSRSRRNIRTNHRHDELHLGNAINRSCDFIWKKCEKGFQVIFHTTT